MSSYKITYFNGQGRAEVTRILLALGGKEFEDVRVTREEWQKLKADTPFGQLPILEVDGEMLCQGNAMAGFVAGRVGRGGKTDLEQARARMIVDCVDDVFKPFYKTFGEKDEDKKKELRKNYCEKELPPFLEKFEKMLAKYPSGHFIGDDVTWPDIAVYQMLNGLSMFDYMDINTDKYPKITALVEKVKSNPKIAAHISKREKTTF